MPTVSCTVIVTDPSYSAMAVYWPTTLTAEDPDDKRDIPVATPSVATLATSGVAVFVPDHVAVVKFIP